MIDRGRSNVTQTRGASPKQRRCATSGLVPALEWHMVGFQEPPSGESRLRYREGEHEGALHHAAPKTLFVIGVSATLTVFGSAEAPGQEKCKINWVGRRPNAKYTAQHTIDVGDVPGHQVRILELHRTFPDAQPNCEGLKLVDQWLRGYSDYIDLNGPGWATR